MPRAPLSPEAEAFVRRPNACVVATLRPDGTPHTASTWYDWVDGEVLLSMDPDRLRLRNLRHDPRVSLTVSDIENWYWQVTMVGRVVRMEDDEDFSGIDRLSNRYIGQDYVDRDRVRVNAWIAVESWHGWDPVRYGRWEPGVSEPPV